MEIITLRVGYLQTNCYVIYCGGNGTIVVDPGGGFYKIDSVLKEKNVREVAVLLTHAHFDHILSVCEIKEKYDTTVYIHSDDADGLNGQDNLAAMMGINVPFIKPDILLYDGQVLDLFGCKISVLHTPGHTRGSVCYIIENNIFSGDTLFFGSYGRTDFPGGNHCDMKKSLVKLFNLPGEYKVYPGHGASTELSYEKEFNDIVSEL